MYLGGDGAIELLIFSLRWKFNKILGLKHQENHIISNRTRLHFINGLKNLSKILLCLRPWLISILIVVGKVPQEMS